MSDPTLMRLVRHSAWATARTIAHLATLPDATLALSTPGGFGTVGATLAHFVSSQAFYVDRLERRHWSPDLPVPERTADLAAFAEHAERSAAALEAIAARGDDAELSWVDEGVEERWPASVVLAQAIHHATEHRAQIFAALAANGIGGLTLDDLDVWAHGAAPGA